MGRDKMEQPDRRAVLRIFAGSLLGLLIEPVAGWQPATGVAEGGDRLLQAIPRRPRPAAPSPPLLDEKVAQAYRIAKAVPELLEQIPCYCGCFNLARHQNNLDCYVDRHADG